MPSIARRKHPARAYPGASPLAAALFAGLVVSAPGALAADAPSADAVLPTRTLGKVEVKGEREKPYTGRSASPKFDQPLVDMVAV